jgi:hypothetical protein
MWVTICLFSLAQLVIAVAALLRLLPALFKFLRVCLRGFLVLSFRLYYLVLNRCAPFFQEQLGLDLLTGTGRIGATLTLSIGLGLALLLLLQWRVSVLSVGLFVAHGLLVGLAWDEIQYPGDLHLGVRLE